MKNTPKARRLRLYYSKLKFYRKATFFVLFLMSLFEKPPWCKTDYSVIIYTIIILK